MNARIGRPKLDVTRSVLVGARFTADEARQILNAAHRANRGKSQWIREVLLAAAGADTGPGSNPPLPAPHVLPEQPSEGFLD